MPNKRQKQVELKRKRNRIILLTFGILFFIYLTLSFIFDENGFLRYIKLKSFKKDIQVEINLIKKQNEETKKQIDAMKKDPNLVEELARGQGLMKEGELIFQFKDEQ